MSIFTVAEDIQGISFLPHFEAATNPLNEIINDFDAILIDNLELFLGCESLLGYEYIFEAMNMIQSLASSNKNKEFVVTIGIKTMTQE